MQTAPNTAPNGLLAFVIGLAGTILSTALYIMATPVIMENAQTSIVLASLLMIVTGAGTIVATMASMRFGRKMAQRLAR